MTTKTCYDCNTRRALPECLEMCQPCYDYASWENTHSDNGHDHLGEASLQALVDINDPDSHCPVCHLELDPRNAPVRKGHSKGIAKSHGSHAGHDHPLTKAARAACRRNAQKES